MAGEDVQGLRSQSEPDGAQGSLRRAADRCHGWSGKSVDADLLAKIPRSAEVSFANGPCLYAGVSHRRRELVAIAG